MESGLFSAIAKVKSHKQKPRMTVVLNDPLKTETNFFRMRLFWRKLQSFFWRIPKFRNLSCQAVLRTAVSKKNRYFEAFRHQDFGRRSKEGSIWGVVGSLGISATAILFNYL